MHTRQKSELQMRRYHALLLKMIREYQPSNRILERSKEFQESVNLLTLERSISQQLRNSEPEIHGPVNNDDEDLQQKLVIADDVEIVQINGHALKSAGDNMAEKLNDEIQLIEEAENSSV